MAFLLTLFVPDAGAGPVFFLFRIFLGARGIKTSRLAFGWTCLNDQFAGGRLGTSSRSALMRGP